MEKSQTTDEFAKKIIVESGSSPKKRQKKHAYLHEKTTPIPGGIKNISKKSKERLKKATIIPQKTPALALEQIHCNTNQNYPLFYIQKSEAFLIKKFRNVNIKERWVAARKIKKLSHEMQQWIHSHVYRKINVIEKNPIEFYELLEKREERHFQIDRIIKYLSDT